MNNIKNKKITYFCGLASSLLSPSFSSMNKVTELPPLHQFPSIAEKKKDTAEPTFVTNTSAPTPFPNTAVNMQQDASAAPPRHNFTTGSNDLELYTS